MENQEIVQKLWNLCNVLRDDGISYQDYVTELTYILFLKMAKETETEEILDDDGNIVKINIPEEYRWDILIKKDGIELKKFYYELLQNIGEKGSSIVKKIYTDARSSIDKPVNLQQIIQSIDQLDWYSAKSEGLANLYEGLLEKNANELKSGAGQYFTPRVLIDVITELVNPQAGEKCNDPAAGTFGFMIAADRHIKENTNDMFDLSFEEQEFQRKKAFSGGELVKGTYKLALMNAMLHDIDGEQLELMDTLSNDGKKFKNLDVVLSNPPFGTKKGAESISRDDLTYSTSNKQLNFLQHIYRSLNKNGNARCGVVLPDNVLFADGDGTKIREDLMEKCNLHTVLRLPSGIFYAQGVKTNVLFFTRGTTDEGNTKGVWFYDLRTNMKKFGKTNPLKEEDFNDFKKAYNAEDRTKIEDERWSYFTREQITEKGNSLDLGLIKDDSIIDYNDLPEPLEIGEEIVENLSRAISLMEELVGDLKKQ